MNKLRNEKGAALVLTVLIITLLMVTVLGLFTQVTNTTKQINTMENEISAQLISEMGIDYYRSIIDGYVNENDFTDINDFISDFLNENPSFSKDLDSSNGFQIFNPHIVESERTDNTIPISYTSIGTSNGAEYETIDTITITITEGSE